MTKNSGRELSEFYFDLERALDGKLRDFVQNSPRRTYRQQFQLTTCVLSQAFRSLIRIVEGIASFKKRRQSISRAFVGMRQNLSNL